VIRVRRIIPVRARELSIWMSIGCPMQEIKEPIVTLERVKIQAIHLSSIDLEVTLKIQNPNPIDAILRELPFTVFFHYGKGQKEIASGNTGRVEIPADGSIEIPVPVTSYDLALIEGLAEIIKRGRITFEIKGNAVIDHILGWTLPITERIDITGRQILDALEGKGKRK
jgi:LEA14-like dessication related protein